MSFFDEIRKLTQPYDENDEEYFDDAAAEPDDEPTIVAPRRERPAADSRWADPFAGEVKSTAYAPAREVREVRAAPARGGDFVQEFDDAPVRPARTARAGERVVNIHATTSVQVVLSKPERFEQAAEIADHLRAGRTVVINLEATNKDVARRLVDFLSGAAYAFQGAIKKAAINTYIITPCNAEIMGDLIDELENSGVSVY